MDQARRAAEFSEILYGATLEERMHASLKFLREVSPRKIGPRPRATAGEFNRAAKTVRLEPA